jgi:anti-anti-sigma regulatory factor
MKQKLVVIRLDDAVLVWLSGAVGHAFAPVLHDALRQLNARRSKPFVLDLTEVRTVDDAALSVLAAASTRAGPAGGIDLRLPHGHRCRVTDAAGLRDAIRAAYPATA